MAKLSAKVCGSCPIKSKCSESKYARVIQIHDQEKMLQTLKYYVESSEGRQEARERVKAEHASRIYL